MQAVLIRDSLTGNVMAFRHGSALLEYLRAVAGVRFDYEDEEQADLIASRVLYEWGIERYLGDRFTVEDRASVMQRVSEGGRWREYLELLEKIG